MYPSTDTRNPLYSCPHFSLMMTGLPVSELRKGFGLIGIAIMTDLISKTRIVNVNKINDEVKN